MTLKQAIDLAAYLKETYGVEPAAGGAVAMQMPQIQVEVLKDQVLRAQVAAQIVKGLLEHRALLDIGELATGLFDGDIASAIEWLHEPNARLGGKTPMETAQTEGGGDRVRQLITQLEHGVLL